MAEMEPGGVRQVVGQEGPPPEGVHPQGQAQEGREEGPGGCGEEAGILRLLDAQEGSNLRGVISLEDRLGLIPVV